MKTIELTFEILKVLTLSDKEKHEFLSEMGSLKTFSFEDADFSEPIYPASKCFAIIAAESIRKAHLDLMDVGQLWDHVRPLISILDMMLEVSTLADYFWIIAPNKSITGPLDDVWDALRVLSVTALRASGVNQFTPVLKFSELISMYGVSAGKDISVEESP